MHMKSIDKKNDSLLKDELEIEKVCSELFTNETRSDPWHDFDLHSFEKGFKAGIQFAKDTRKVNDS